MDQLDVQHSQHGSADRLGSRDRDGDFCFPQLERTRTRDEIRCSAFSGWSELHKCQLESVHGDFSFAEHRVHLAGKIDEEQGQ